MTRLREQLAYWLVAVHGVAMFVLFAAPLQMFLLDLAGDHLGPAMLAGGLMAAGFAGTIAYAGRWLDVSASPAPTGAPRWGALRLFRMFVGNGDLVQAVATRIDPNWKNPYSGRAPQETMRWLTSMELIHWAALVGSAAPIAAAFLYGHEALGFVYLAANLVYNVAPNLVIRDTRRRLVKVIARSERAVEGGRPVNFPSGEVDTSRGA